MGFSEIQQAIVSSMPAKGAKCEICGCDLEKFPSISAKITFLLKKFLKRFCLMCAKEVRALIDLRITQAEKGECQ